METEESESYVFVELWSKRYAVPAGSVREVLQVVEPTPVPSWPDEVLGLIDVRGELIPLVDVAGFLGHTPTPLGKDLLVLVIASVQRNWGMLVQKVEGVRASEIQSSGEMSKRNTFKVPPMCRGIAMDEGGPVVVLDTDALIGAVQIDSSLPLPL